MATRGQIIVAGEVTCENSINVKKIVSTALEDTGYDPADFIVSVFLHTQSSDIARGVDKALEDRDSTNTKSEMGAGDQGTVYGYATDETPTYIPLALELSHRICRLLDASRKDGTIDGIKSDGKAQVSIEYEDGKPIRVAAIVVSVQHEQSKNQNALTEEITHIILLPAFSDFPFDEHTQILINPSGRFVEGGPGADTGLTGRKIMVDTYGGLARHGGGAFSGKDPTKVDRSGAYMARFIAKHIVVAGLARQCEIAISYAIGKAEPVAVNVNTFSTGTVSDEDLTKAVTRIWSFKPKDIISELGLRNPIFAHTSCYGHVGNNLFPWERINDRYIQQLQGSSEA
jgi:S-adenosylmethionine synthetase